nr:MAG TPA: hypothetical protein [Caudoviricetes sp.]
MRLHGRNLTEHERVSTIRLGGDREIPNRTIKTTFRSPAGGLRPVRIRGANK